MTKETTIRRIGNSARLIIPEKMLQRYNLSVGDRVHVGKTERSDTRSKRATATNEVIHTGLAKGTLMESLR